MRRLWLLLVIALPMAGCISLDSVRYVGPYYRTPTGLWEKAEGRSSVPEALLPCPEPVCTIPDPGVGGSGPVTGSEAQDTRLTPIPDSISAPRRAGTSPVSSLKVTPGSAPGWGPDEGLGASADNRPAAP
jgi:hypothetical protein